jgi:HSP20 family protein
LLGKRTAHWPPDRMEPEESAEMISISYAAWPPREPVFVSARRPLGPRQVNGSAAAVWSPHTDLREDADQYLLYMDVPGVPRDAIEISLEDGVLSVSGARHREADAANGYRRTERASGRFRRRFALPDAGAADQVSARVDHGVLGIIVPKHARATPRRIEVRAS